jgi:hypothetical protein
MPSSRYLAVLCFSFYLLTARPLLAQDAESAKAFLNSIFKLYANHGRGISANITGKCGLTTRFVHSSLLALIDANVKAVGTDVPVACDSDIICGCQEWDGIWVQKMVVTLETPQRAQALVTFSLHAPTNRANNTPRTRRYTLVLENGQWRIYDIAENTRSLRKTIQKEIDDYAHPH